MYGFFLAHGYLTDGGIGGISRVRHAPVQDKFSGSSDGTSIHYV